MNQEETRVLIVEVEYRWHLSSGEAFGFSIVRIWVAPRLQSRLRHLCRFLTLRLKRRSRVHSFQGLILPWVVHSKRREKLDTYRFRSVGVMKCSGRFVRF